MSLPRIRIITMGGTIAAIGKGAAATTIYELQADRNPVLEALPVLADSADITVEAFAHVPSHELAVETIIALARRLTALRARDAADGPLDGIVVTHGTDTLEETAYLLDLLLADGPPVVITGAARPSSALSADGPLNLLNAVRTAALPAARGRGVMVCMNDRIDAARFVAKRHTSAPDAFRSAGQGHLGAITGDEISFFHPASARLKPRFDPAGLEALARVEIVHGHLGMSPAILDFVIGDGAAGIVLAATGNGSVPDLLKPSLLRARATGILVVRASRVGDGAVSPARVDDECGTIPAGWLSPQKARLLLMLALGSSAGTSFDRNEAVRLFGQA